MKRAFTILLIVAAFAFAGCRNDKTDTKMYTVTFDTRGGSSVAAQRVAYGDKVVKPAAPTNGSKVFGGWLKDTYRADVWVFETDVVTANITLYARWFDITKMMLREFVEECRDINPHDYDGDVEAFTQKYIAACDVLDDPAATQDEMNKAYSELAAARAALTPKPDKAVTGIEIENTVMNGVVYVTPDTSFSLTAFEVTADNDIAPHSEVLFENVLALAALSADGKISVNYNELRFLAKNDLAAGNEAVITIRSVKSPNISRSVTLKIAEQGELKSKFIAAVAALPSPDKVTYTDADSIDEAMGLYQAMTDNQRTDPSVSEAYQKLTDCYDALMSLPTRMSYSFKGNVCTLVELSENISMEFEYAADGDFPVGTYTTGWKYAGDGAYLQIKFEFTADGKYAMSFRAGNADGSEVTGWRTEEMGTYTFTGTQASGGMFYLSYMYDDDFEPYADYSRAALWGTGVSERR